MGLVEQQFTTGLLFGFGKFASTEIASDAATDLNRLPRMNLIHPSSEIGKGLPHGFVDRVSNEEGPGVADDVGNGVFGSGEVFVDGKLGVHDAGQAAHFANESLDPVFELLGIVGEIPAVVLEVVGVAHHRSEVRHLPMHPLQGLVPLTGALGQELARLLPKVLENGPGLEDGKRLAAPQGFVIDDGRHPVVGRDAQEFGLELVASADVDGNDVVR